MLCRIENVLAQCMCMNLSPSCFFFLVHTYTFVAEFSVFVFFLSPTAYQLRTCQPPPPVANAIVLTDDDEFEIGLSHFILLVDGPATIHNRISFRLT